MQRYNLLDPMQMGLDPSIPMQPQAQPYQLMSPDQMTYDASVVQPNAMPANSGFKLDYETPESSSGGGLSKDSQKMVAGQLADTLNKYNQEREKQLAMQNAARAKIFQDATNGTIERGNLMQFAPSQGLPSDEKLKEFLDALEPYEFSYKGDEGKNNYQGIMAQDMEKSDLGKNLVMEIGGVKHINMEKAMPVIEQSMSNLFDRLKKLEGSKNGKSK